jgi:transcriptional regulator with XRE-family HTH domain
VVRTVGVIVGENVRAERRRLKLTAEDTAARYADAGMSATVLMNIESGRRRNAATIDEWLRLAYTLGVPPESLLLPEETSEAEITPGVNADRRLLLQWIRGATPLSGTDERHYRHIAALSLPADSTRAAAAREELMRRVGTLLDTVDEVTDDVTRVTRRQVYDLLGELHDLVGSGATSAQVLDKIESYKDRLADMI